MKLSFSTLGCPDWDMGEIIKAAVDNDFAGVEIRGYKRELDVSQVAEFKSNARETLRRFKDAGLEIACFSSSVRMSTQTKSDEEKYLEELKRYADLCERFETPYIRIFGGEINDTPRKIAMDKAVITMNRMVEIIKNYPAKIVLETHDDWMAGDDMKELMEKVNSDSLGLLWDVNHPYMFLGEDPNETWEKTRKWIYHTHWKDSKIAIDTELGFEQCLMGEGDLPLQQIYDVLKKGDYDGYLSLEWEKVWNPDIEEPEIAFPQYAKFMKELMN